MALGRKTGGRRKGTPNKATADVKAAAQAYTDEALRVLVSILRSRKAPAQAKVAAARELLDRGHGKPAQAVTGPDGGPVKHLVTFGGRYRPTPAA